MTRRQSRRKSPNLLLRWCVTLLENLDLAIRCSFQRWRIWSEQLAPPPHARLALLFEGSKPVLPQHDADFTWWPGGEGVVLKQMKHIRVVREQVYRRTRHEEIVAPSSQRGKPQIPIKPWLIGSINPRGLIQFLW